MNPDCRDGKHASCSGDGWDLEQDQPGPCPCDCHRTPAGWRPPRHVITELPTRAELIADLTAQKTGYIR